MGKRSLKPCLKSTRAGSRQAQEMLAKGSKLVPPFPPCLLQPKMATSRVATGSGSEGPQGGLWRLLRGCIRHLPCQSLSFWAPAGSSGAMCMSGVGWGWGQALPWLLGSGVGEARGRLVWGFLRSRWMSKQENQSTLVSALPKFVGSKP